MKDSIIRFLQLFLPSSHFSTTIVKEEARYLGYIGNKVLCIYVRRRSAKERSVILHPIKEAMMAEAVEGH